MEKIGLVTVLYNSDELLEDFFKSIAIQDYKNYVIYLIDNTPGILSRQKIADLESRFFITNIKHVECEENIGAAAASNIGIKSALDDGCADIILLNNDIVFYTPDLFSSLVMLSKQEGYKIIAPKIFYYQTNKVWYAGGDFLKWKAGVRHIGDRCEDNIEFTKSGFVTYAPTTFVFINSEVFLKTGLLDERYFIYVEDLDLMYRAMTNGYKIWYEANLHLEHKVSSTTGGILSSSGFYYNTRNRIYFARKFFGPYQSLILIAYVFISLFYHALKQAQLKSLGAFVKGFFDGFKMNTDDKNLPSRV